MKTSFMVVTYKRIKEFQKGIADMQNAYPSISLKTVREYLLTGNDALLPIEMKLEVDRLAEIRRMGISDEMFYLEAKAKEKNIIIPNDILNGLALDPVLEPAIYSISENFRILEFFSWFLPDEFAEFEPRKF